MKIFGFLPCIIFCLCVEASGQQPAPAPNPQPAPVPKPAPAPPPPLTISRPRAQPVIFNGISPIDANEPASLSDSEKISIRFAILQKYIEPLYRKPTKDELQLIAPSPMLLDKYHEFLARPNTGLFKLLPDAGCADNSKVIAASEICMKFTFPGAGNSYSFRTRNYRMRNLADLTFSDARLRVTGVLMHGVLVSFGNVSLDTVSLQTAGIRYLTEFQPSKGFNEANDINELLGVGVRQDGFLYTRSLPVVENNTYALRSIAYRGRVMNALKGIPYNELDFDRDETLSLCSASFSKTRTEVYQFYGISFPIRKHRK